MRTPPKKLRRASGKAEEASRKQAAEGVKTADNSDNRPAEKENNRRDSFALPEAISKRPPVANTTSPIAEVASKRACEEDAAGHKRKRKTEKQLACL